MQGPILVHRHRETVLQTELVQPSVALTRMAHARERALEGLAPTIRPRSISVPFACHGAQHPEQCTRTLSTSTSNRQNSQRGKGGGKGRGKGNGNRGVKSHNNQGGKGGWNSQW